MPKYNASALSVLNIAPEELEKLDYDKQQTQIRKAYRRLALLYHPDKHPSTEAKAKVNKQFIAIVDALKTLTGLGNSSITHPTTEEPEPFAQMNKYVKEKQNFTVPMTGFDFFMEIEIDKNIQGLLKEFSSLQKEEEMYRFAEYYAPFIHVASQLQKNQIDLARARCKNFTERNNQHLLDFLLIEARKLIIRLFAEEYLDDFSYREFVGLGFGSTKPIFAVRKLINPLKWVAAILGVLDIYTHKPGDFLVNKSTDSTDIIAYFTYFLSAPIKAAHAVSELLASPVNQISNPLSELTSLPPEVFTSLMAASIIYQLITQAVSLSALTSTALLLTPYVNIAISIYALRDVWEMFNIGKDSNNQAIQANSIILLLSTILPIFNIINLLVDSMRVVDFMRAVAGVSYIKQSLNILKEQLTQGKEASPLCSEVVNETVIKATQYGYRTAHQSHLFFNTPKNAVCENHPSFLQKTGRFFGVTSAHVSDTRPWDLPTAAKGGG
jgi:hypothetical protein